MAAPDDVPASTPLDDWLARLAEPTGNPGGGSAAALILAVAAALLRMVAGYSQGPGAREIAARVEDLRAELLAAGRADGAVSARLGAALASEGPGRDARVQAAAEEATASSLALGGWGARIADELVLLVDVGNTHLDVDTAVAAEALRAGLAAADLNARENDRLARRHGATQESDRRALATALRVVAEASQRLDARMQDTGGERP